MSKYIAVLSLVAVAFSMGCGTEKAAMKKTVMKKDAMEKDVKAVDKKAMVEDKTLALAIANPARTDAEKARDKYRHPKETLAFFEVKPTSHVLELWPGKGWYSKILVPYVGAKGKFYTTDSTTDKTPEKYATRAANYAKSLAEMKNASNTKIIKVDPSPAVTFGMENQLDVVLTFRNLHNWAGKGYDVAMYKAVYKTLKPGGIFGVVEHRSKAGATKEETAKSGYMDQKQVIADIKAAGFELVAASEINANAKDTKNYEKGVWTLPPVLRLGDTDKAKYEAIGESDRMTLKFRKPAKK